MNMIKNLPTKNEQEVRGESLPQGYRISRSDNTQICLIGNTTSSQTANDIARAITEARDAGYAQAMAEIRSVIGVKG